jgi:hypothetical protein
MGNYVKAAVSIIMISGQSNNHDTSIPNFDEGYKGDETK